MYKCFFFHFTVVRIYFSFSFIYLFVFFKYVLDIMCVIMTAVCFTLCIQLQFFLTFERKKWHVFF